MAGWRIGLLGPLLVIRDGEPLKLRTRHQALLVARLAAFSPKSIDRAETAEMLWPDAEPSHRAAYLRRAVMELRRSGLEIQTPGDRLLLVEDSFVTDFSPGAENVLSDIEHPIAYEIQALAGRNYHLPTKSQREDRTVARSESDRLLDWIAETLIVDYPEVALEMLARNAMNLLRVTPPGPILRLCLRAADASPKLSANRVEVNRIAAMAAILLTRYGLAERILRQMVEESLILDDEMLLGKTRSIYAFLLMERRRWSDALEMGRLATESALRSGDGAAIASSHHNMAGIQWHMLRFEQATKDYETAYYATEIESQKRSALANLVVIWGVYDVEIPFEIERPTVPTISFGSSSTSDNFFLIGYGLKHRQHDLLVEGAARLLKIAGEVEMERVFCIALDYAALAFSRIDRNVEAAACVRLGSKLRFELGHRRSPAELLAIRKHVPTPYFGRKIQRAIASMESSELNECAGRIIAQLRLPLR